jgi:hypothetical protein
MPAAPTAHRAAADRVRARALATVLRRLTEAMAASDAAAVLACEPALAAALDLTSGAAVHGEGEQPTDGTLGDDLAAAREALLRCRALGSAHAVVTEVTLDALGRGRPYGRTGAGSAERPVRRDFHQRA